MSLTLRRQRRTAPYAKVAPLASDARDTAARAAVTTRDWAAPKAVAAKEWAGPKVEPAVDKVKDDLLPVVTGAVAAALAASEPVRHEAATRGSAAIAALKGEVAPPKPKKHRLRKLFLLASVLGAAYAGWKAWAGSQSGSDPVDAWKTPTTYGGGAASGGSLGSVPAGSGSAGSAGSAGGGSAGSAGSAGTSSVTPVSPVAPVDTPTTDDPGGAGPDEALADAADEALANQGGEEDTAAAAPVTEKVTPAQAKKASQTAAKGAAKTPKSSST